MFEDRLMSSISQVPVDLPDRNQPEPHPLDVPEAFGYRAHLLSTSALVFTRSKKRKHRPIFDACEKTLWRWVQKGELPEPVRIGGKCFWHAEDVAELVQQRARKHISADEGCLGHD